MTTKKGKLRDQLNNLEIHVEKTSQKIMQLEQAFEVLQESLKGAKDSFNQFDDDFRCLDLSEIIS